jgi:hypothetical protein
MTDPDRLGEAAFNAYVETFREYIEGDPHRATIPWGYQTSEMRAPWVAVGVAVAEVAETRLRGLLARLEWAGRKRSSPDRNCPACFGWPANGHDPGCELAAELTRTTSPGPPEGVERPGT